MRQSKQNQPPNFSFECLARERGFQTIAGVDEAGRGPLAGPVVAAACILPNDFKICGINDSKKLTPLQRYQLYEEIIHHPGLSFGLGIVDALRIDQINILQATFEAMLMAIDQLNKRRPPDYILVDGSLLPPFTIPSQAIIEGDTLSLSIATASIIAKESRDRMMNQYDLEFPLYSFKQHKGYATPLHLTEIALHGPSPIHRLTFSPFKQKNP
jgi:ribonuclease HII